MIFALQKNYNILTMEIEHFESLYPEDTRFSEIEQILNFVKEGNSCQVVSIPGVGRSNLLGYLAYNRKVRLKHLEENQKKIHFVLLDFSEIRKRNLADVNKFIFLGILDSLRERGLTREYEKVNLYFKESVGLNDELVIFSGLKKTVDFLAVENDLSLVFLFERFEEYVPNLTSEFFANLRVLRNRAKYHFSAVFSLNKPIEDLVEPMLFSDFFEYVAEKIIYLPVMDKPGLMFRVAYLGKVAGKKIDKQVFAEVISLTGGHGRLTILCLEAMFSLDKKTSGNKSELTEYFLSKRPIRSSLFSIWNSLNPSEQQFLMDGKNEPKFLEQVFLCKDGKITIPLFRKFVDKTIMPGISLKKGEENEIFYDAGTNEIKIGERAISDSLTWSEFRLLKLMLENKGKVLEKDAVINAVWGDKTTTLGVTDQALDQLVFRLRKKIEPNPNNPVYLITIKGRGFKLN